MSPIARARKGIGRTFQRLEVFGSLSVRDNIRVAVELHHGWSHATGNISDQVDEIIQRIGLADVAEIQADLLSTGSSRMMELGRALAISPTVLLLDEPGSGLDDREVVALADIVSSIAQTGTAIVLVEHDVDLVMRICSRIWVLASGSVIASGTPDEVQTNEAVIGAYLGGGITTSVTKERVGRSVPATVHSDQSAKNGSTLPTEEPRLSAEGRARAADVQTPSTRGLEVSDVRAGYGNIEVLHGVSLSVRPGEVVALLGPNGAGKTTLLRTASGQLPVRSGSVSFDGDDIRSRAPERLVHVGLCTIPEGRGVFPNMTVSENLRMWSFACGTDRAEIETITFGRFPQLSSRRRQLAGTLSGGEQQMLAVSRALVSKPKVLLLDEISMGLAPMIVSLLYDSVAELAASGIGILVVEQFAEAALSIADRGAVLKTGHILFNGSPQEIRDNLGELYLGSSGD
jgi:branched-chain amino acid transport system ATP-binding protein